MKIKYEFVNGEVVEIEVSEEWAEVLAELDRQEYNNDKKETRRHCTMDVLGDEGEWMTDENADPANLLLAGQERETVQGALDKLTPKQRDVLERVYIEGWSITRYAAVCGISQPVATKRIYAAEKKFKKVFKNRV